MDDPKKFVLGNFLKMFQNGPIRKVITKKSYLEDFLIFSPAVGHPGSTLRKILEDFFKKSQVRNSHYLLSLVCDYYLLLIAIYALLRNYLFSIRLGWPGGCW